MNLEDQVQFNINLSKFDRLTRKKHNTKKNKIMKTFIHKNGGYLLFGIAITGVILWRLFFPNLHWK